MATDSTLRDLILLVADSNIEFTMKGLLSRPEALRIRQIDANVVRHPERDPGCLLRSPEFLRPFQNEYRHALVMLDREGSGQGSKSRQELERSLEEDLAVSWDERAAAIVLDPELEIWLWSDSPEVDAVLGWQDRNPDLRSWLVQEGFADEPTDKPERPKEATEQALRIARKPRSSALYRRLAQKVSFRRCTDPAFEKLKRVLREWFPPGT